MRGDVGRRILALVIGISLGVTLSSSNAYGQGVALGAKGGVTSPDFSSNEFEFGTASGQVGFVGGGFITISGGRVAVQPEILFAQRSFSVIGFGGTANTDVAYVDVPILIKIGIRPHRKVRPALIAGGFVSLEASCSVSGDVMNLPPGGDCEEFFPARGQADAGFVFGGAVDVGLSGRTFITFDARYNVGLLNLRWDDVGDNVTSRALVFMGGVGVLLGG